MKKKIFIISCSVFLVVLASAIFYYNYPFPTQFECYICAPETGQIKKFKADYTYHQGFFIPDEIHGAIYINDRKYDSVDGYINNFGEKKKYRDDSFFEKVQQKLSGETVRRLEFDYHYVKDGITHGSVFYSDSITLNTQSWEPLPNLEGFRLYLAPDEAEEILLETGHWSGSSLQYFGPAETEEEAIAIMEKLNELYSLSLQEDYAEQNIKIKTSHSERSFYYSYLTFIDLVIQKFLKKSFPYRPYQSPQI